MKGRQAEPICIRYWQLYAEAAASAYKTYLDSHNALDNDSDEELEETLRGSR
ncbi:hypothetical protein [Streptomyces sp. NPDC002221]|uniref:hypothetical protein n=1 Tax=Streptomyces sp. NPDC002221 TaxID=3364639 RepID=UPI0036D0714E